MSQTLIESTPSDAEAAPLRLECFPTRPNPPQLVPGRPERDWMDAFAARHPYRCLPLTMANTTGWELLCPVGFEAEWNGGLDADSIRFRPLVAGESLDHLVVSHFTHGVMTFHVGWLFRTPPGWALRASGSPNRFKHGLSPLEGLVETDWLPYPFTMNWRFTAPGRVRFEKDEPFCFIQPVQHHKVEAFEPVGAPLSSDGELSRQYEMWKEVRADFNARMADGDPAAMKQAWQRYYFRGEFPDAAESRPEGHVNKRRLGALPEADAAPQPEAAPTPSIDYRNWPGVS